MDHHTRNALYAFIQTLTYAQVAAMMDVFSSYVENVETDSDDDHPPDLPFIKAVSNYIEGQVAAIPARRQASGHSTCSIRPAPVRVTSTRRSP